MSIETLTVSDEHTPLDLLIFRRFGIERTGMVEDTLNRNPTLANDPPFLPLARRVDVSVPAPTTSQTVARVRRLWG